MLKRTDHIGVIVDDLAEAAAMLEKLGLPRSREFSIPNRLQAAFYRCGDVDIELIEITEPEERRKRLGDAKARIEHIAIECDGLEETMRALTGRGIEAATADPVLAGGLASFWTRPDTTDGVTYQLMERRPSSG